jgi:pimeloyl-ACP methyl ester carboxylesterase
MDVNMHIEQYGSGRKILFIHGSGCSSEIWRRQKQYLQTSMEVVLVDLPGHGKSPGNGCDSTEQYGDAVYKAMRGLSPDRYYVAGHSLGGAIAMSLALFHPDAVRGLILIGTGAKLRVLPSILDGILKEKERTIADMNSLSFSQGTSAPTKEEAFKMMMSCRSETIYKDFSACDRFDIMNSVDSIRMPTLVLCGKDDVLTPVKYSRFLNEKIAGSELVLIGDAGHMAMLEKPDAVNRAMEIFLGDHP